MVRKKTKCPLPISQVLDWTQNFSEHTTIHGYIIILNLAEDASNIIHFVLFTFRFVWYTRTKNKWIRGILMILCFSACLSLPAFVAFKAYEFSISNEVKTNQEWITALSYNYPYIAICHPKFFNSQKLKGKCFNVKILVTIGVYS